MTYCRYKLRKDKALFLRDETNTFDYPVAKNYWLAGVHVQLRCDPGGVDHADPSSLGHVAMTTPGNHSPAAP